MKERSRDTLNIRQEREKVKEQETTKKSARKRKLFPQQTQCLFCNEELDFKKRKKYPNIKSYQISEIEMFTPNTKKIKQESLLK